GRFASLLVTNIIVGLLIWLGLILCIAPGVYFAVSYMLVSQVVVLEGLSGGEAMRRSKELIGGYRGRVFGVLLLVGIVGIGFLIDRKSTRLNSSHRTISYAV